MKKLILTLLGVAFAAGAANAQMAVTPAKVDVAKLRAEVAKSDADIADPKKNTKAATWVKRGEVLVDVDAKPVNGVYAGMPENILKASFGDVAAQEETVEGRKFKTYNFEHFKAYLAGSTVGFYTANTVIVPDALDKAYDAFAKAYEMDAKTKTKVGHGMSNIHTKSFEDASAQYSLRNYKAAAVDFRRAYRASAHPASAAIDTAALYYSGMTAVLAEEYNEALEALNRAIAMGYESEGEAYYFKAQAQYGLGQKDATLATLNEGIMKYPTSETVIDMLMKYYSENGGNVESVIPIVQSAIDKNPENANLYQGLANVYDKLGRGDDAINTIKKAVEIAPNSFFANYLEGLYIVRKGDRLFEALGKQTFTSAAEYQQALGASNDVFRTAIPPLEKALDINPSEAATVELLKNLTFRLRQEAGMQAKYDKYNALLDQMLGAAQ